MKFYNLGNRSVETDFNYQFPAAKSPGEQRMLQLPWTFEGRNKIILISASFQKFQLYIAISQTIQKTFLLLADLFLSLKILLKYWKLVTKHCKYKPKTVLKLSTYGEF